MTWYKIDMNGDSLRDGDFHKLCREFQRAFIAHGAPEDMALLAHAEPSNGHRRLFLTPGCASYVPRLLEGYRAADSTPPNGDGLTLVFGVPRIDFAGMAHSGDGMATGDMLPVPKPNGELPTSDRAN